ncbi:MAG: polysaccharide biosynthesis/export family protein [Planktomarina sp.]
MKYLIIGACALALTGCGTAYISPDVPLDDPNVQVIPLTQSTATAANTSRYRPKSLPAVFFRNSGGAAGAVRGAGVTPELSLDRQERPKALAMRLPPSAPALPYEIGVGDVVLLATPSAASTVEQLSGLLAAQNSRQGYTVQDDGAIAIPDVGRINLAGLTLESAEAEVFQKLVENQIDPSFSIEIAEFNSKRVSIGGAVVKPAVVPITLASLTLEEALAATGGFATKDQDYASIRLYREGTLYEVPLIEYFARPEVQKTRLAAGDSIFVDTTFELDQARVYFTEQIALAQFKQAARVQALNELNAEVALRRGAIDEERQNFITRLDAGAVDRDYVYLTGEVNKPSRFALPFEQKASLADALFGEGGLSNETANPTQVYVLRGQKDTDRVAAYNLDFRNAANLVLATRLELRPDDIIFVAEQPITRWNRVIQQIVPSLITSGVAAVK